MNFKFIVLPIILIVVQISLIYAKDEIVQQNISLINVLGNVKCRHKSEDDWKLINSNTKLISGCEVKTLSNSKLELGLEPALTVALFSNTKITFTKLLLNKTRSSARTHVFIDQGLFWVEMPSYMTSNLFFSIETSSAIVYLRKAVIKVFIENNFTIIEVYRGAVKVRQKGSGIEKVVHADKRAVVHPSQKVINTSVISDTLVSKDEQVNPDVSIAMLSIFSPKMLEDNLESVSDIVAQELEIQSNTEVLFLEDVRSMLSAEGLDKLLKCNADSCISKIGNFLGVDMVVIGRLGQLGKKYMFNLKLIDALRNKTVKRVNITVEEDAGNVLGEVSNMVTQLVEAAPEKKNKKKTKSKGSLFIPDSILNSEVYRDMAWIFPGSFMMGSKLNEGDNDEYPEHSVKLNGFFIDKYEVTKEEFQKIMGYNPSVFKGCKSCPADNVSWDEANDYCEKVGKRLPTEAEWEYTCRAGSKTLFHYGNSISSDQANFDGRKPYGGALPSVVRNRTYPVGSFNPNAWQVYDMHGNVWEWCADWYNKWYYEKSPKNNPKGPLNGKFKVLRGGSWKGDGLSLRSANRISFNPAIRLSTIGFRCVRDYESWDE